MKKKKILLLIIHFNKDLGFNISDDEINDVDRIDGELNLNKYIEILKEVESSNFRKNEILVFHFFLTYYIE